MNRLRFVPLLLTLTLLLACIGDPDNGRIVQAQRPVSVGPGDAPEIHHVRVEADERAASPAFRWLATAELHHPAQAVDFEITVIDVATGDAMAIESFGGYPTETGGLTFECGSPCTRELEITLAPAPSLTERYEGPLTVYVETYNELFSGDLEGRFEVTFLD